MSTSLQSIETNQCIQKWVSSNSEFYFLSLRGLLSSLEKIHSCFSQAVLQNPSSEECIRLAMVHWKECKKEFQQINREDIEHFIYRRLYVIDGSPNILDLEYGRKAFNAEENLNSLPQNKALALAETISYFFP